MEDLLLFLAFRGSRIIDPIEEDIIKIERGTKQSLDSDFSMKKKKGKADKRRFTASGSGQCVDNLTSLIDVSKAIWAENDIRRMRMIPIRQTSIWRENSKFEKFGEDLRKFKVPLQIECGCDFPGNCARRFLSLLSIS